MKRAVLVLGLVLAACAAEATEEASTSQLSACASPPALLSEETASLSRDVLPLLLRSCAASSCHAPRAVAPLLGSRSAATGDTQGIRDALVGKPSKEVAMAYVTPGDPANSYLMHKLDGDLCGLPECASGKCGSPMPRGGDPLPENERDVIRRWIAQGAREN